MIFQQSYAPTAQVPQDPNIMAGALIRDFGKDVADIENSIYKRNMTAQAMEAEAAAQAQKAEIERAKLLRQQQKDAVDKQYKEDTIRAKGEDLSWKKEAFGTKLDREDAISDGFNQILTNPTVADAIARGDWKTANNTGIAVGAVLGVPKEVVQDFLKRRQDIYNQDQGTKRAGIMAKTRVKTAGMRTDAKNQPKTLNEVINDGLEYSAQDSIKKDISELNEDEAKAASSRASKLYGDVVSNVNEPVYIALQKFVEDKHPDIAEQILALPPSTQYKALSTWAKDNKITESDLLE